MLPGCVPRDPASKSSRLDHQLPLHPADPAQSPGPRGIVSYERPGRGWLLSVLRRLSPLLASPGTVGRGQGGDSVQSLGWLEAGRRRFCRQGRKCLSRKAAAGAAWEPSPGSVLAEIIPERGSAPAAPRRPSISELLWRPHAWQVLTVVGCVASCQAADWGLRLWVGESGEHRMLFAGMLLSAHRKTPLACVFWSGHSQVLWFPPQDCRSHEAWATIFSLGCAP